jgi:intracellular sulfur oxidation DsrE/DsrF family protein
MDDNDRAASPSRATFLSAGAIGLAVAAAANASAAQATSVANRRTIDALLHKPAHHKQVIGAPRIDGGAALRFAGNALNAFEYAFAEGPGSLHVAAVFYGTSLLYVADDDLWNRYRLFDVLDQSADPLPAIIHAPQNPFLRARANAAEPHVDFSIETLTKRGVTWMVCNNALTELTRQIATAQNLEQASVYSDFRQHFVTGVTVVPSGVATVVLAQEAGFALIPG